MVGNVNIFVFGPNVAHRIVGNGFFALKREKVGVGKEVSGFCAVTIVKSRDVSHDKGDGPNTVVGIGCENAQSVGFGVCCEEGLVVDLLIVVLDVKIAAA